MGACANVDIAYDGHNISFETGVSLYRREFELNDFFPDLFKLNTVIKTRVSLVVVCLSHIYCSQKNHAFLALGFKHLTVQTH